MIPPQPTAEVTGQHLVLVAQHEQLGVLGQIGPGQHRQQAEQAPQQAVGERQQHFEWSQPRYRPRSKTPAHGTRSSFRAGQGISGAVLPP